MGKGAGAGGRRVGEVEMRRGEGGGRRTRRGDEGATTEEKVQAVEVGGEEGGQAA
jgi:hypothetical protein